MFQAPKLTNAGKALYYANLAGDGITFTKIQMGSGTLSGAIANLEALVQPVVTIDAAVKNNNGQYVDVSGAFSNAELTEGFYWREIGVFAADPDNPDDRTKDILYCYQNAYDTADFIPVASVETVEKSITVPMLVGDASTVSCTLTASQIYATVQDLEDHDSDENAHKALLEKINEALKEKQDTITANGILKGGTDEEGNRIVEAATAGSDYQAATQNLTASTEMALEDTVPFYSSTAGQNRRTTLQALKDALGVLSPSINVTTCAGAAVTCTDGTKSLTGTGSTNFSLPNIGTWTVTAVLGSVAVSKEVEVTGALQYNVDLMMTTGIAITSAPTKTAYGVGEAFDPTGMTVTATYADETTEDVTADCTFSPATMAAGTTEVTVTYERAGITQTAAQAVTVRVLESIAVTTAPDKTTYFAGESFDATGMSVTATMSDGTTKAVTGWTYSPTGVLAAGTTEVTISYTENGATATATQAITIRALSGISVTTAPTKTVYNYGEKFDSSGMAITASYSDGETRTVTGWTYSPTTALTLNTKTITISYTEGSTTKTCTYTITVNNVLESIAVTTAPDKTDYFAGQSFSTSGMVVTATYADGSTAEVTGYTWSPSGALTADDTEVTISYTENGATATATQAITVTAVSDTLNSNSWATIGAVSDAGQASNYWSTGDTKTITLNGTVGNFTFSSLSIAAFIIGINHNSSREGSNRIHFQIGKISSKLVGLCDSNYGSSSTSSGYFQMNTSNTNSGGWSSSYMRKTLLGNSKTPTSPLSGSLIAALPSDLRAVMKSVTKYSDNTGGGSNTASYVTATTDYLFLLSEYEYQGTRSYANSAEQNYQKQYDYYKAGNSRIHYKHSSTGAAVIAFCRSVNSSGSNGFCLVYTDGGATSSYANDSRALAPGFAA